MRIATILIAILLALGITNADTFINYKHLTKKLKEQNRKNGTMASTDDVKKALKSKDWAVVDVRTLEEWNAASIKGSVRVGRQAPEKVLESIVLDDDDKFIKDKLVVICNTASRASIEAQTFRQMGFKKVKIYPIYKWIDECNPVATRYTNKKYKKGTKKKFGLFYTEHCKK
ncbi:MAG: rhodanese-like domain-containing protein [Sulfurovum sp.]|nr:rhodanese-like domain-containing protein [Sulfurovum sp.]MCB4753643.1 rhodanese-like domain-containing protein [Sulfurovum sp.]MCB4758818.1 rhodanese-like domain-containing protein [Sulfurovum sp.]MCB4760533.1 rhodanese-like domain-containing protein [Sulfurovum sp.]MCB4762195.1 rhodanese-like domain-containing protein [Sulfurovum sp.]